MEESANYLQRFFFNWKLKNLCVTSQAAEVEAVCAITSAECDLSCPRPRNNWGWGRLEAPTIPSRGRPAPNRFRGCSVLYCTVLCCTVTVICRWLPVLWSVVLVTSKSRLKLINCKYYLMQWNDHNVLRRRMLRKQKLWSAKLSKPGWTERCVTLSQCSGSWLEAVESE